MRPKLKSDTFFIPMGESIYLRNNEKSLAIKGKTLANWLERLAPALDGQHDLADICQMLPEEKRPLLTQFLLTLVEQGYLKDTTPDLPHSLSAQLVATYGPAITFIDSHTDSGASRFQRFLTTPVLAIASGECLLALAHALLETGNRAISLLDTGEEATDSERLQQLLEVLQERDQDLQLTLLRRDSWHDEAALLSLCASANTVLYFSTGSSLEPVARLAGYCRTVGVPFLPAISLQDEIHIGPFQLPDRAGCWQCYWRRYQAARGWPAYTAEDRLASPPAPEAVVYAGKPAIGIIANMLAFEFFKYGTGVHKNTLEGMVRVLELQRLQIVKHQLFPHPLCNLCSPQASSHSNRQAVLEDIARLMEKQTSETPSHEVHIEEWIDKNSGIFTRADDLDYYQLPLIRSQIEVPLSSDRVYTLPLIKAAGLDYAQVRLRLVRQAAGRYLTSLADPRRICRGTYQQLQNEAVCPTALSGWLQRSLQADANTLAWVWGAQLTPAFDFTPLLLPGAAVSSYSHLNRDNDGGLLFEPEAGVTSVAASWSQALAEGLAELSLTLVPASEISWSSAKSPSVLIERETYSSDPRSAAYLAMLDILNARVALLECAALAAIPCVALYVNERYVGLFAHWNMHCAIRQALERAVLTVQIERTPGPGEQSEILPLDVATRPSSVATSRGFSLLGPSLAEEDDYTTGWHKLATCLREQGWNIAVALLPGDCVLERLLPCALRLLAVRQGSEGRL